MDNYSKFITEAYKNLFKPSDKEQWAEEVYALLEKSYAPIGGLAGRGFKNKEDMIKNIPMWKLVIREDKVVAVVMYKDKGGRKSVAVGTDGSSTGKKELMHMMKEEFTRSFSERSGPALKFTDKHFPALVKKYSIPAKEVEKYLPGKEIRMIKGEKFKYERQIGGKWTAKQLMGTPGKKIETYD